MIGRSSSPSNCRPPCIAIWSPTLRSLRKNTVRQSNPSSLCRRCSHGSCRRIAYLLAYGAQRAVPVEFDDGHHADVAEAAAAACSMALEGIAVLRATSRGSPVSDVPIRLVTYAYPIPACGSAKAKEPPAPGAPNEPG